MILFGLNVSNTQNICKLPDIVVNHIYGCLIHEGTWGQVLNCKILLLKPWLVAVRMYHFNELPHINKLPQVYDCFINTFYFECLDHLLRNVSYKSDKKYQRLVNPPARPAAMTTIYLFCDNIGSGNVCWLTAPSHYPNQCDLLPNWFCEILLRATSWEVTKISIPKISFKTTLLGLGDEIMLCAVCRAISFWNYFHFSQGSMSLIYVWVWDVMWQHVQFQLWYEIGRFIPYAPKLLLRHCSNHDVATQTVHDDVIKWKYFPRYWPFVRGIEFPTQRPVTRSFVVYFDLRPSKRLSKQSWDSWDWWFETPLRP